MAEVIDNIITKGLSGKVANSDYTFRQQNGKTFLVKKSRTTKEPTEAQLAVRTKFSEASAKAKADIEDAEKKAEWQAKAKASKGKYSTAYGAAFAYYYSQNS